MFVERHHDAADTFDQQDVTAVVDGGFAEGDHGVDIDAAALMLRGEIGRQRRAKAPWRDALDRFRRKRQAERGDESSGIARRRLCRIVSADDRHDGIDVVADLPQMPDERGDDRGFSHVGPGRGDEDCGHDFSASHVMKAPNVR